MADSRDSRWQDAEPAMVGLNQLAPHPANVRKTLTDLDELAASIGRQGLVEPLEVMPAGQVASAWPEHTEALAGYPWVLLAGHRRLAAARRVFADDPQTQVPVLIRRDGIGKDRVQQVHTMITEAVANRSLSPIEQARAFDTAVRALGYTQREIAELYGCTQAHVSQQLLLLRLPDVLQQAVERHDLTVRDGLKLARLDDQDQMGAVWRMYRNRQEYAWIKTVDQAIAEQADWTDYQARRQAALSLAEAQGVRVVDPVEEFGREVEARWLTSLEQVEAARASGTLVAGISGMGELEHYTTGQISIPGADPHGPDANQRRAAAAARERAGRLLAAHPPPPMPAAAEPMVDAFLRCAPDRWRPIARRWLQRLRIVPAADVEPATWWKQVHAADRETRAWAAHCLALAESEYHARTHSEWDEADIAWLWRLVHQGGYVPRPWERRRLTAAEDEAGAKVAVDQLPLETPPDWFEPYEQCLAPAWLSAADLAWLERDPQRFHMVEQHHWCGLEEGHTGVHGAHVQDAHAEHYPDFDQRTGVLSLWAWWRDNPKDYDITPEDACPVAQPALPEDKELTCLLFAGHPGRHCADLAR